MIRRQATAEEIIATGTKYSGQRVGFRHFVMELYSPRAKNGVQHREWSRSRLYVRDGRPYVRHHGQFEEITGEHFTLDNGQTFVAALRLNSKYL